MSLPFSRKLLRSGLPALLLSALLPRPGAFTAAAAAEVPRLLNHQGRIAVGSVNFHGTGSFKFALVGPAGTLNHWSNDGTRSGEPAGAVALNVTRGLYSVLLGDPSVAGMRPLPGEVFQEEADLRLRVWFNDGIHGFQHIQPDQRLAAVPYALSAGSAVQARSLLLAPPRPVIAWGSNQHGQTGVPALTDVRAVAAGEHHSLAMLASGTVTAWGLNADGQTAVPGGMSGVTAVAAGTRHSLALRGDGTLTAWGSNSHGQTAIPAGLPPVSQVAAGDRHTLVLLADGTVRAWGDNTFQQTSIPPDLANVTAIASGYEHCLALKGDGTVTAWGSNAAGQTGVPPDLGGVTAIAAGAFHSLALKNDGTVVAWGWNNGGQTSVPPALGAVVALAGGYSFSAALTAEGTVTVWGHEANGGISVPAQTGGVTGIAAGSYHVLALRAPLVPAAVALRDGDNQFAGKIGIRRAAAVNALEVEGNASKTTAGNWLANSDRRIKTEIAPIADALETLSRVRLVDFRYTPDYLAAHPGLADRRYPNVIAQEFAEVFPEEVQAGGETLPDGSAVLQVDTYPLTIYTAAAVQELHRAHEDLKAEHARLQRQLQEQEARLRRLEEALPAR